MDKQSTNNLTNVDHWIRLVYMLIIGLLLMVARMVVWIVAVLQFLIILFTGEGNLNLRNLGQGAAKWCFQAYMFLTFNSNTKPFPFADWPEIDELPEEQVIEAEVIPANSDKQDSQTDQWSDEAIEPEQSKPEDNPAKPEQEQGESQLPESEQQPEPKASSTAAENDDTDQDKKS